MTSNQVYGFLTLAACSLLLVQLAVATEQEVEELGSKLYGYDVKLSPEETLSSLKRLGELYAAQNERVSHIRAKRIQTLVNACDMSTVECSHTKSVKMHKLIRNYSRFTTNIVPYLKSCQAQRFAICKPQVEASLAERVKQVQESDKALGKKLVDGFPASTKREKTDELFKFVPLKALKQSVLALLRAEKSWDSNVEYGKNRFETEDFRRLISEPCARIRNAIGDSVDYLNPLLEETDLISQIDSQTLDWMAVNNVCWTIHRNTRLLIRDSFKALNLRDVTKKNPHF